MTSEKFLEGYYGRQTRLASESRTRLQDSNLDQEIRRVINSAKRRKRTMVRLSTPVRLSISRKPWEVCLFGIRTAWKFTAQPYQVVFRNSPIMECIENEDLKGAQVSHEIFQFRTRLFPHRSAITKPVLGWCLRHRDGEDKGHVGLVPYFAPKSSYNSIEELPPICHFVAILESFEFLPNHSTLSYGIRTHQKCFFVVSRLVAFGCHRHVATLIRIALGNRKIDQQITPLKDDYGAILLYCAARYLGEYHTAMMWRDWTKKVHRAVIEKSPLDRFDAFWSRWDQFQLETSLVLVRDLVLAGSGLFDRNRRLFTPLLNIFNVFLRSQNVSILERFSNNGSMLGPKIQHRGLQR